MNVAGRYFRLLALVAIAAISAACPPSSLLTDLQKQESGGTGGGQAFNYYLYVTNYNDNTISSYSINPTNGALSSLGAATSGALNFPYSDVIDTSGKYLYTVGLDSGSNSVISSFTINPSSGVILSTGTTFATQDLPNFAVVDPLDRFLYAVNNGSSSVSEYTLNSSNGILTPIGTIAAGTTESPQDIAEDPSGSYVYVTAANGVYGYTINSDGTLTQMGTSPFTTVSPVVGIAADPVASYVFVVNNGTQLTTYRIMSGGALSWVSSTASASTDPRFIAVHPSGRFAYVIYSAGMGVQGYVSEYSINSSGVLTAVGSVLATGIEPYSVIVDPTGSYLYVANFTRSTSTLGTVSAYSINKTTGALAYINQYSTGYDPSYIAIAKEAVGP